MFLRIVFIFLLIGFSPLLGWSNEKPIPTWAEYFESDNGTWRLLHSEKRGTLAAQQRTQTQYQQGQRSEKLQFALPMDSCAVLGHSIGFPLLIEDLSPTLYIKSDQPGVAIGAQIVLPNSIHPETGKPITYIVSGTKYTGSGRWEKLGFWDKNGNPTLFQQADQLGKLLRAELKMNLNLSNKYVRQLVLLVEPGTAQPEPNTVKTVWIDSLEVFGSVAVTDEILTRFEREPQPFHFDPVNFDGFKIEAGLKSVYVQTLRTQNPVGNTEWVSQLGNKPSAPLKAAPVSGNYHLPAQNESGVVPTVPNSQERSVYTGQYEIRYSLTNQQTQSASPTSLMQIRLSDQVLTVDDVSIGVRMIEYNGEPLAFLRQLKFNAVWIKGQPNAALLQEAKNAGIWLVCTPPSTSELSTAAKYDPTARPDASYSTTPVIDSNYDNVLAWNLGDEWSQPDYTFCSQWVSVLQSADRMRRRPILCTARSGVREYSRIADILMLRRESLLSSLDMLALRNWHTTYASLARPDTPFWCTIQTQPSEKLANQWAMFEANPQYICPFFYEQLKMQVYQALSSGVHGILFTSNTALTNNDPETEFRRTALELLNWELQLVEEWFAAGHTPTLVKSNRSSMSSIVIQWGRSRLLIPMWQERRNQQAVGAAFVGNVKYVVSGIPETFSAYHLVPGSLYPINTKRIAGGLQIELPEANLNSLIFFGEDDAIYANIGKRAKEIGPRAAYLACHLAELELATTEQVLSILKQAAELKTIPVHPKDNLPLIAVKEQETMIKTTKDAIDLAKNLAGRNPPDYARAYLQAEVATRGLRVTAREMLLEATRNELNLCMTPVSVSFATLPYYLTTYQRMNGAKLGENRLIGGDMENINQMSQTGWDTVAHRIEGVAAPKRDTIPNAKHSGNKGLQLVVLPSNAEEKPAQFETTPLWLTTPPIPVRMGETICVSGWVRIPKKLESTVDGLMIFDSLGGEALALRFLETRGAWQEFAFYRNVPADGNYYVFFGLQGFGQVHIDDVRVSAVQFEAPQVPQPQQPTTPTPWQRLNPFQYLPPIWNQNQ